MAFRQARPDITQAFKFCHRQNIPYGVSSGLQQIMKQLATSLTAEFPYFVSSSSFGETSVAKNFLCPSHIGSHISPKGTACFADTALDAFSRMMGKRSVMLPHGFGNVLLGNGQIQKLHDIGNVDLLGAGCAMTAIHTLRALCR